jgi:hypothetical protein
MFIHPDQRAPIARLLQFLRDGEYLASDCARAQAQLAPDSGAGFSEARFGRSPIMRSSFKRTLPGWPHATWAPAPCCRRWSGIAR